MAAPTKTRALILIAAALGALGWVLAELLSGGRAAQRELEVVTENVSASALPGVERGVTELVAPERIDLAVEELARSTVLWPLRVELDLLEASYLPSQAGVVPVGSGATAILKGTIAGRAGASVRAEVSFEAGPNAGRVLQTDEGGAFGATDLYPGLSIVEVRGSGLLGSRREVRLRQDRETLLNIGYGRPGSVTGRVQDTEGEPLEGASVTIDGTRVVTDPEGGFHLSSVAAGQVLVEVELDRYADYQELAWVGGGQENQLERFVFTLREAAELNVAITTDVGGPGPATVILLPGQAGQRVNKASAHRNMRFPWHHHNPIEVHPGRPTTIAGLPDEPIRVYVFRPGAQAVMKAVSLHRGKPTTVKVALKPAKMLVGYVREDGEPVPGATVRLEAPNRVRATLAYFRQPSFYLETAVMPDFPPAVQEVVTDRTGRFVLTAWSEETPTRYLEARGPGGLSWAGRLVGPADDKVDLTLLPLALGSSTLELDFPGRWQGLPIEVVLQGAPTDVQILSPADELRVGGLLAGRWHLRLSWDGTELLEETFELEEEAQRVVPLPLECIEGQDAEAWRRAGREYPLGS